MDKKCDEERYQGGKSPPEAGSEQEKGRPFLLQHRQRDVSGGSTVVIDLEGVMASFYALV